MAAVRGVLRVLNLRGLRPGNLLKQLQEAALSFGSDCLEVRGCAARHAALAPCMQLQLVVLELMQAEVAVCVGELGQWLLLLIPHACLTFVVLAVSGRVQAAEKVAERAASPRWRRAFVKLGGVEALLKLLRGGLDADSVRAIMRALAELLKEGAAQEVRGGLFTCEQLPAATMCLSGPGGGGLCLLCPECAEPDLGLLGLRHLTAAFRHSCGPDMGRTIKCPCIAVVLWDAHSEWRVGAWVLLQVMVSEGGVPYLVHGLVHPDLEVSCCCSQMLARLASTQQQQPLDAIRWGRLVLWCHSQLRAQLLDCAVVSPACLAAWLARPTSPSALECSTWACAAGVRPCLIGLLPACLPAGLLVA